MTIVRSFVVAACVTTLVPAASKAAVVTFAYTGLQTATNSTFTTGLANVALVGTPATGYSAIVGAGLFFRYTMNVTVTGSANPAAASGYNAVILQPVLLGLNSFGQTITSSNPAAAVPLGAVGAAGTVSLSSLFDVKGKGTVIATGLTGLAGGLLLGGNFDASNPGVYPKLAIGVPGPTNIYSDLTWQHLTGGTTTISAVFPANAVALVTASAVGDAGTPPTYATRAPDAGDTIIGPGSIVISAPEPASLAVLGLSAIGLMTRRRKA